MADSEGYGVLRLSPKAWPLLKRSETPPPVMLRALHQARAKKKVAKAAAGLSGPAQGLFEALKALRMQLAREQGVPPYVIFPDKTLSAMAASRPGDAAAMLAVSGVGEVKMERYGEAFLGAIREYEAETA